MNYLANFKVLCDNALSSNKQFILIPYYKYYYIILILLKIKGYIKNFICVNSNTICKAYILIELKYLNNYLKKFKIIIFKNKLKFSIKLFKDILKLCKFSGLFLFSTSLGILTLEQIKFFKIGGILILYIY